MRDRFSFIAKGAKDAKDGKTFSSFSLRSSRFSFQNIRVEVRLERSGDFHRAILLLVGFQQRDIESGHRGSRAVERMAETVFAGRILEFEIHATRLEIAEIRATRDFKIGVLPRCPDLDVVGFCRAKTE